MNIALDIDGVLANTDKPLRKKINEEFGLENDVLTPGETYNNVYVHKDELIHNKVNDRVRELYQIDSDIYRDAEVIEGALAGALIIEPVVYITRRPSGHGIREATEQWLQDNGFPSAPVHFIPKGTCKSEMAKTYAVDLIVEDSPHEITSCISNGLDVIVMRYKYNDSVIKKGMKIADSWVDVLRHVKVLGGIKRPYLETYYDAILMEGKSGVEEYTELEDIMKKREVFVEVPGSYGLYFDYNGSSVTYLNTPDYSIVHTWHRMSNGSIEVIFDQPTKMLTSEQTNAAYFLLFREMKSQGLSHGNYTIEEIENEAFNTMWWV